MATWSTFEGCIDFFVTCRLRSCIFQIERGKEHRLNLKKAKKKILYKKSNMHRLKINKK